VRKQHQMDAAYWHEWAMFGLPGGVQLFAAINVALTALLLGLFVRVLRRHRSWLACSNTIAGVSALVLPIHAAFAWAGRTEFHLPVSIALIAASFVLSLAQLAIGISVPRRRSRLRPPPSC
jgi:hypothetical protein